MCSRLNTLSRRAPRQLSRRPPVNRSPLGCFTSSAAAAASAICRAATPRPPGPLRWRSRSSADRFSVCRWARDLRPCRHIAEGGLLIWRAVEEEARNRYLPGGDVGPESPAACSKPPYQQKAPPGKPRCGLADHRRRAMRSVTLGAAVGKDIGNSGRGRRACTSSVAAPTAAEAVSTSWRDPHAPAAKGRRLKSLNCKSVGCCKRSHRLDRCRRPDRQYRQHHFRATAYLQPFCCQTGTPMPRLFR